MPIERIDRLSCKYSKMLGLFDSLSLFWYRKFCLVNVLLDFNAVTFKSFLSFLGNRFLLLRGSFFLFYFFRNFRIGNNFSIILDKLLKRFCRNVKLQCGNHFIPSAVIDCSTVVCYKANRNSSGDSSFGKFFDCHLRNLSIGILRSEERRVGKECRSRWGPAY